VRPDLLECGGLPPLLRSKKFHSTIFLTRLRPPGGYFDVVGEALV
jgi:hypothetical protein